MGIQALFTLQMLVDFLYPRADQQKWLGSKILHMNFVPCQIKLLLLITVVLKVSSASALQGADDSQLDPRKHRDLWNKTI